MRNPVEVAWGGVPRRWAFVLAIAVVVPALAAAPHPAGAAACNSPTTRHVEASDGDQSSDADHHDIQGFRADIHVNSLTDPCHPVRSIGVFSADGDLAELGWLKQDGDGHPHTVFFVAVSEGIYTQYDTPNYPNGGVDRDFKVQDLNHDSTWTFLYEGNVVGSHPFNFGTGEFVTTNTERWYPSDGMYGHFFGMQVCTDVSINCNYHNPNNLREYVDNVSGWEWCKVDNREHFVRENGNC